MQRSCQLLGAPRTERKRTGVVHWSEARRSNNADGSLSAILKYQPQNKQNPVSWIV
ncbi:hypothetical protein SpAn4DRAFT_3115 [Sporomusa ovata]|uniref:Uncharacterized protein n=1 Tax=Sporomusa ovata TaxID=2378 RepID=A0A0U1KZE9_9FIRM|nr:hypothetical protein SpAn4DRAFT_3115 [Sporomusa ovata]